MNPLLTPEVLSSTGHRYIINCVVLGGGAPNAPCARSNFHHSGWGGGGGGGAFLSEQLPF